MLSESICVSIASHEATDKQITASTLPVVKDAAIFTLDLRTPFRPTAVFKKSSTRPNSLAVSQSHVFAAQAEKAVVHVYNLVKGNQEATIPFGEKVTVVATAGSVGEYLIIGTENGNVLIWEVSS
jgi:pre-rRNA-processing protein IPI3